MQIGVVKKISLNQIVNAPTKLFNNSLLEIEMQIGVVNQFQKLYELLRNLLWEIQCRLMFNW
jgi:hypothetical protein